MLQGPRVILVPLDERHLENCVRWLNDWEVVEGTLQIPYFSLARERAWFQEFIKEKAGKTDYIWAIETRDNQQHIGVSGLHHVDFQNLTGETGTLLGEKDFWGKRIALEAAWLRCEFAFNILGLNRLQTRIYTINTRSLNAFQRPEYYPDGFYKEEGVHRQEVRRGDQFIDVWYGSILKEEFERMSPPWEITPQDFASL